MHARTIEGFSIGRLFPGAEDPQFISPDVDDVPSLPGTLITVSPFIFSDRVAAETSLALIGDSKAKVYKVRATIEVVDLP